MNRSLGPIRALTLLSLLVVLVSMTTPVAAQSGAEPALDAAYNAIASNDVSTECAWWWTWC